MARTPRAGRAMVRFIARTMNGVRPAPFPGFIVPCLATLRPKPPAGDKWQYEFKLDGYRMQVHKRGDAIKVYSRNGLDWTDMLPTIVAAARKLLPNTAVLDGEIIVQGDNGLPDFQALRVAIGRAPWRILFYAFDLLHLDGYDLRG